MPKPHGGKMHDMKGENPAAQLSEQCGENSGGNAARKVIEYVHIPASFRLITFLTFPHKVFLSFVPQFFPFIFLTFPNNFPHFSSFFFRTVLTVLLTFQHFLYYFPHVSS